LGKSIPDKTFAIAAADTEDVAAVLPPFLPGCSAASTCSAVLICFQPLIHLMLLQYQQNLYRCEVEETLSNQTLLVLQWRLFEKHIEPNLLLPSDIVFQLILFQHLLLNHKKIDRFL
jgi:hypothetical protein